MTGMPIWYELMTPDPAGVAPFYRAVGGWDIPAAGNAMPNGSEYREIKRPDGGNLGGVLTLTKAMQDGGARPGWIPYFHVKGAERVVETAEGMGATTHMAPTKMHVGTLAMIADPQGAPFYLMDPIPPANDPNAKSDVFDEARPGHCRWNELATTDAQGAKGFYAKLLGWEFKDVMPMGAVGDYLFIDAEGRRIGAINPMIREGQPPMWVLYLGVDEIGRALEAAKANGGAVLHGPHEVPGGDHIFVASDPAGAMVAFVGPKGG
ncbi:MAG TPA: VOC family protein [Croceibacterium sp.]|nr:VOC family protein [Croceibacterium sp.]